MDEQSTSINLIHADEYKIIYQRMLNNTQYCLEFFESWNSANYELNKAELAKSKALMAVRSCVEQQNELRNYLENNGASDEALKELIDDRVKDTHYHNEIADCLGQSSWLSFYDKLDAFFKKYDDAIYDYTEAENEYKKAGKKCIMAHKKYKEVIKNFPPISSTCFS